MSYYEGRWVPDEYFPTLSVQEHYDEGYQLFSNNEWDRALIHFMVINYHFQDSPFYSDAVFHSAICYYFKEDFDLANQQLSHYLTLRGKLKHFEKVFEFKYDIANCYRNGRKKHLFGSRHFPKFASGKGNVMEIYEEIIASLPGKEIAAKALFDKATLLRSRKEYQESMNALQTLTRRFPKHTEAAEAFLEISEIYVELSHLEAQNPDQIALASVNLQRFRKSFPGDERIEIALRNLLAMKEVYAQSLFNVGRFFERKKKPPAAAIYYKDSIQKYPETEAAEKSRRRLSQLGMELDQTVASTP